MRAQSRTGIRKGPPEGLGGEILWGMPHPYRLFSRINRREALKPMGYERNQQATDNRRTVDSDRATHLVRIHLDNDARHHAVWTRRAREIRERVPDSLPKARAELLADGVISETEAVRTQLADEIKDRVEATFETIHAIGTEDALDGATVPGLMQTALERFVSAVNWQHVARGFMSDETEPTGEE